MATYSRNDLRNAVMFDLTVLDANEAPSAEDSVFVLDRIQQTLELLADDGLIPFDLDSDVIPAPYMVPLCRVIVPTLALAYGKGDKLSMYEAHAEMGMKALRKLKAKPYFGATAQADYF